MMFLVNCYPRWQVKTAFVRSSVYLCTSPGSRQMFHFVFLLWPCRVLSRQRGGEGRGGEDAGRGEEGRVCLPCGVALYMRFKLVVTRMVWFAVTATQVGCWIVHKVETSPALIINYYSEWEEDEVKCDIPSSCTLRILWFALSQTSNDWLLSSKHIPRGEYNFAAFPFPSAKPYSDPASVETSPVHRC